MGTGASGLAIGIVLLVTSWYYMAHFVYLPFRSPGGKPQPQDPNARGTLLVITTFLSRDFPRRQRYVNRVFESLTSNFSGKLREDFQRINNAPEIRTIQNLPLPRANDSVAAGENWFLLINECMAGESAAKQKQVTDELESLLKKYSTWNLQVVQKQDHCGQAGSLNLVLDALHQFEFWLNWEESWYVNPILGGPGANKTLRAAAAQKRWEDAYTIMSHDANAGRFTFADHTTCMQRYIDELEWEYAGDANGLDYFLTHISEEKRRVWQAVRDMSRYWPDVVDKGFAWPSFSLRPSLIRVANALRAGYFDPDPGKKAVIFEQEWAMKWTFATDGEWPPTSIEEVTHTAAAPSALRFAIRDKDHKSTYHYKPSSKASSSLLV